MQTEACPLLVITDNVDERRRKSFGIREKSWYGQDPTNITGDTGTCRRVNECRGISSPDIYSI